LFRRLTLSSHSSVNLSCLLFLSILVFFHNTRHPRDIHSFPTRRSSDLGGEVHDAGHDRSRLHETMWMHALPALLTPDGGESDMELVRRRRELLPAPAPESQASAARASVATAASALILSGRKPDQWSPPANTTGACW